MRSSPIDPKYSRSSAADQQSTTDLSKVRPCHYPMSIMTTMRSCWQLQLGIKIVPKKRLSYE
jgi:hypothetical protein